MYIFHGGFVVPFSETTSNRVNFSANTFKKSPCISVVFCTSLSDCVCKSVVVYVRAFMSVCVSVCVQLYVQLFIYVCIFFCLHVFYVCVYVCVHLWLCICVYLCIYSYVHLFLSVHV